MFPSKPNDQPSGLEDTIGNLLSEMASYEGHSEEYARMLDQLVKLYPLKETSSPPRISPDTLAIVAGNLLAVLIMVGYERANVITSKALGLLLKPR